MLRRKKVYQSARYKPKSLLNHSVCNPIPTTHCPVPFPSLTIPAGDCASRSSASTSYGSSVLYRSSTFVLPTTPPTQVNGGGGVPSREEKKLRTNHCRGR